MAVADISKKEGVPVSLIESIACGVPIISNDIASISEVCVDKYDGFLLNVDDVQKWIWSFEQNEKNLVHMDDNLQKNNLI